MSSRLLASSRTLAHWITTFSTTSRSRRFRPQIPANLNVNVSSAETKNKIYERLAQLQRRQDEENAPGKETLPEPDSLLAQRLIQNSDDFPSIQRAQKRLEDAQKAEFEKAAADELPPTNFPFKLDKDSKLFETTPGSVGFLTVTDADAENENDEKVIPDKGFFVRGDAYCDDYVAATAADLPEDEMNELPYRLVESSSRVIETIDFQLPYQMANKNKKKSVDAKDALDVENENEISDGEGDEDWRANYSQADPESKIIVESSCIGCGAHLHCNDTALPGFVPVDLLSSIAAREARSRRLKKAIFVEELCRRCYMLKKHDFLLNVNVCNVDYDKLMGHLRLVQEALILLVVDMTDLPGSIYRQLPQIIGEAKPMIVIGNKVDLLPPGTRPGYLKHFKHVLQHAIEDSGLSQRFNVLNICLASAKTGYGIENLVTKVYTNCLSAKGRLRSDIYVVGCTNAGKSTLFNAFIQSDLCKVRALDLVERVTTSVWPGTTLSLLKFPLMNPTAYRLELRRRRLVSQQAWALREADARRALYDRTGDKKYLTLSGVVENTFKESVEAGQPISDAEIDATVSHGVNADSAPSDPESRVKGLRLTDDVFTAGYWCYDTPGTVSQDQLLDLFTLDELITLLPRTMLQPRTFLIRPGESLLLGGIAVVSLNSIEGDPQPVFLTAFCSDRLPVTVLKSNRVETHFSEFLGTKVTAVPFGGPTRLEDFPKLESRDFVVVAGAYDRAAADVVVSSVGWVTLTTGSEKVSLTVSTPGGRGVTMREPILPFANETRGQRISGTSQYKTLKHRWTPGYDDRQMKQNQRRRQNYKSRR